MTKDEAQRRRWTFYEAVKIDGRMRTEMHLGMLEAENGCIDLPAASVLAQKFGEKAFFNKAGTIVQLP
jgi:hypothetical protein